MYVGNRDTNNDAFCGICGEITDRNDMEKYNGRCEYCHTLNSLVRSVILVTRREIAGHITSDTAEEQIKETLIETAAREL